ncbi:clathrin heavy chain linker domain-containing protein 1-like [Clarias gariepinus]
MAECKVGTESVLVSSSDRSFMKSLKEFIESEKEQVCCPDEGPDDQRYTIYSTAFDKIIDYATAYKPVLTAIKKEYDDLIASVKNDQHQAQMAHGKLKAMLVQPTSLMYYQRRAAQLQQRIATIQRNTADLQTKIKRVQKCKNSQKEESLEVTVPPGQIPGASTLLHACQFKRLDREWHDSVPAGLGLTLNELLNPESLDKHLERLEQKRNELLDKKRRQYVPVKVKTELDLTMKVTLKQRDELSVENEKLLLRILVCEDDRTGFWPENSEQDDPGKIRESKRLAGYIERFLKLFEMGDYETAARHAAMSPHGVLRNINVMEKFKTITAYEGALHPLLLFFRLLMMSAPPGKPLSERLSLEGVGFALRHGCHGLVTFGVSQSKLTYSEELGDLIASYEHDDLCIADTCLALAQIIYLECSVIRKAALTMCKRGLTTAALEFIHNRKEFTIDDFMFVLRGLPSVALLQDFTQPCDSTPALVSVGFISHYLLNSDLEHLALQLLERIQAKGQDALQKTILEDETCSIESWSEIAARCEQTERLDLAQDIASVLLLQDGAVRLSPGLDGAELMEHVFM